MKFNTPKFNTMKLHISKKNLVFISILGIAIFIFYLFSSSQEGFGLAQDITMDNAMDNSDVKYNSYIAPAGNTVLYDDSTSAQNSTKKKCKQRNNNGPLGIPRGQIPSGDENLYILKSEVIPPVCPACPNINVCPNNNSKAPPPCPPCARCPEPAFDCKKVPNYNSNNSEYLPRPVLADFSQFGM
jgi:hypothetical protein